MIRANIGKRAASLLSAAALLGLLSACVSTTNTATMVDANKKAVGMSGDVRADFNEAVKLLQNEQYAQGIELLNGVVTKSQNHAAPYINLAIAHSKRGNKKAAEESIKKALELEPDNPVAGNEYALILRRSGRFSEAREVYEAMIKRYPHYPMAHKNLAILCDIYLRDYECALRSYEAYGEATPEDGSAKIWIADVQRRLGR